MKKKIKYLPHLWVSEYTVSKKVVVWATGLGDSVVCQKHTKERCVLNVLMATYHIYPRLRYYIGSVSRT